MEDSASGSDGGGGKRASGKESPAVGGVAITTVDEEVPTVVTDDSDVGDDIEDDRVRGGVDIEDSDPVDLLEALQFPHFDFFAGVVREVMPIDRSFIFHLRSDDEVGDEVDKDGAAGVVD